MYSPHAWGCFQVIFRKVYHHVGFSIPHMRGGVSTVGARRNLRIVPGVFPTCVGVFL